MPPLNNKEINAIFKEKLFYLGEEFNLSLLSGFVKTLYQIPIEYATQALSLAKTQQDVNKKPIKLNYSIKYLINEPFNAGTCNRDGASFIFINSSVPYLLFKACISYAELCDIKKSTIKEKKLKLLATKKIKLTQKLDYSLANPESIERLFQKLLKDSAHINKLVFQYALFLYEIAIRFLTMHECMHVILGHTGYVKQKFNLDDYLEFSEEREHKIPLSTSQALEFMADRNTCRGILVQTLQGNSIYNVYSSKLKSSKLSREMLISRSVTNALSIILHIFPGKLIENMSETLIKTHPHPFIRMQWMITEMSYEVGDENSFNHYFLKPFALNIATFKDNFEIKYPWTLLSDKDLKEGSYRNLFSYTSYKKIIITSKQVQKETQPFKLIY
ncbi:hypothetical protein [Flavivirga sp. 57AJ16]|uniref:hypothetical protein n=1 Tax=Flavivirga sp. 57AJ16 TaxID=3025307 RepID=UPI002366FAEC|nr:hypothetical protein [Flavivirga sp. 57AJ16]MDD7887114.1 hypothetical protein [Flavivirga sp. 57AJ16]